ncbi:EAL domain-containing protein [Acidithiobacillus caldus]|uniref:EAL domain-containing protein n=1 Tax=Acidithiobacillus caldus TaxID=33059 RepID=UPI0009837AC8|nr:EAL domain-containing protein [Acidithiobacillus caldus]
MDTTTGRQFQRLISLGSAEAHALGQISGRIQPEVPRLVQSFYDGLASEPDCAPLIQGKLWALLGIYARWVSELFSGSYTEDFWEEQRRIGLRHAQLGIPHELLMAGFARIRTLLIEQIYGLALPTPLPLQALNKLLDLCQHLAGVAYVRETEHTAVKSLRALTRHFSPQEFFHESARLSCRLVQADGAALILREGDRLRYTFFEGLPDSYRDLSHYTFSIHEGTAGAALSQNEAVYVPDYPRSTHAMPEFVAAGLRSSLALPLTGPDGSLGVLAVSWFSTPAPERLPEDQWDYLRLLSDMLAGILYRAQLEERLKNLATRDMLTGLPNRLAIPDRIAGAMARTDRHNSLMALLFIDLDGFKAINDRLGHAVGDQTLKTVAERLHSAVRKGDTVARYAGDEFLIILEEAGYMTEIEAVAQRLLHAVRCDVTVNEITLSLSASVGLTVYPFDESTPEVLIHHADMAMYEAKKAGGNQWRLYEGEATAALEHDSLLRELEQATDRQEFCLYWQPIVDLETLQISGAEALLRWQHPQKGLLAPAAFLEVLENSHLMPKVGHWILETALRQAEQWHQSGRRWDVHINLAAVQLKEPNFSRYIQGLLSQFPQLRRAAVWLEIVERVALDDVPAVAAMIQSCRALGIHFTLDDFGTGAAAIQYLVELECSGLKIDKSLIRPMRTSNKHHTMVHTLVDMAESLSIKVVAEGIEDAETADHLRALGVTHAQGYYFSRPVPVEQLETLSW